MGVIDSYLRVPVRSLADRPK